MIPFFSPDVAAWVYAALIALALWVVKETGIETVDRGGYVDSFRTADKAVHAGISFILTLFAAWLLGVSLFWDVALTFGAGIAWELLFCDRWSHRWRDIVVDAAGTALAVLLLALGASVR